MKFAYFVSFSRWIWYGYFFDIGLMPIRPKGIYEGVEVEEAEPGARMVRPCSISISMESKL